MDQVRLATWSVHLGGKSSIYFKLNLSSTLVVDLDCSLCHVSGYYLLMDQVRLATWSVHLGGKSSIYFKLNLSSTLVVDLVNSVCFWLYRVNT
jgi:hypothetical protein